ncbi:MAG: hypothetical protein GY816_19625 [Cytophagales bacterium]|nr:hypothetical protein [Cytophagales bacterium]
MNNLCMGMQMTKLLFPFFIIISLSSQAQILTTELNRRLDVGREMMLGGSYDSAEVEFNIVLKNMKPLPSEMAYFYGRNSYHLGEHKRAINWLNKYIQLKGARGVYYEESVDYLQLSEDAYLDEQRSNAMYVSENLASSEFDCGGLEKMVCPVCHGSGVIITQGTFDVIYKTCPYSLGEGFLSCDEYNLFMKGLLEPKLKD